MLVFYFYFISNKPIKFFGLGSSTLVAIIPRLASFSKSLINGPNFFIDTFCRDCSFGCCCNNLAKFV